MATSTPGIGVHVLHELVMSFDDDDDDDDEKPGEAGFLSEFHTCVATILQAGDTTFIMTIIAQGLGQNHVS